MRLIALHTGRCESTAEEKCSRPVIHAIQFSSLTHAILLNGPFAWLRIGTREFTTRRDLQSRLGSEICLTRSKVHLTQMRDLPGYRPIFSRNKRSKRGRTCPSGQATSSDWRERRSIAH